MKFKLKFFAGIFTISAIAMGIVSTNNAKANVVGGETKNKKMLLCVHNTPDEPIFYGNSCESGTFNCIPNPCE